MLNTETETKATSVSWNGSTKMKITNNYAYDQRPYKISTVSPSDLTVSVYRVRNAAVHGRFGLRPYDQKMNTNTHITHIIELRAQVVNVVVSLGARRFHCKAKGSEPKKPVARFLR